MRINKFNQPPKESIITNNFSLAHYSECYQIELSEGYTVDEITSMIFALPRWVRQLMVLRDYLARKLSLRAIVNKEEYMPIYSPGNKAVIFTVAARNENEIVMEERDKHLDFRTSILLVRGGIPKLYWSTIIYYNNVFGRLYFFFIKPIHKLIIRSLLARVMMKKS